MAKYEFIKKDEDTTILKYKNKEFEIKRDVELQKEFQSINKKARMQLMSDLTEIGKTAKDFIIARKDGSKTYEDKTNLIEMEQAYIREESVSLFQNLSKKYFNMSLEELIEDMELTEEESNKFGGDFAKSLASNGSPSKS